MSTIKEIHLAIDSKTRIKNESFTRMKALLEWFVHFGSMTCTIQHISFQVQKFSIYVTEDAIFLRYLRIMTK